MSHSLTTTELLSPSSAFASGGSSNLLNDMGGNYDEYNALMDLQHASVIYAPNGMFLDVADLTGDPLALLITAESEY